MPHCTYAACNCPYKFCSTCSTNFRAWECHACSPSGYERGSQHCKGITCSVTIHTNSEVVGCWKCGTRLFDGYSRPELEDLRCEVGDMWSICGRGGDRRHFVRGGGFEGHFWEHELHHLPGSQDSGAGTAVVEWKGNAGLLQKSCGAAAWSQERSAGDRASKSNDSNNNWSNHASDGSDDDPDESNNQTKDSNEPPSPIRPPPPPQCPRCSHILCKRCLRPQTAKNPSIRRRLAQRNSNPHRKRYRYRCCRCRRTITSLALRNTIISHHPPTAHVPTSLTRLTHIVHAVLTLIPGIAEAADAWLSALAWLQNNYETADLETREAVMLSALEAVERLLRVDRSLMAEQYRRARRSVSARWTLAMRILEGIVARERGVWERMMGLRVVEG